ncbi:MAG: hypothetical protein CVU38_11760 [Chloroflexi bacterium HGW-Chloroflexi-1]|nr:MAG: hypothetical protein CVU38_11760 [Chloroflexi bacterium HGW-Chloroflexi-1]
MSMTQTSADYFARVASTWDELRARYFTEALREAAIAAAYLRPEMTVADVGCGTGFMAAGLAPAVSRVYALDGAPAMLDVARRNLSDHRNVVFQQTDGSTLPLPDASVDAVFANMYLHHCPDPAAAIREMARVLRPGGRVIITDMEAHPYDWFREEMADEWLGFERPQVRAWLHAAGLVNVIVDCSGECCATGRLDPTQADSAERGVQIEVFLARGTRRAPGVQEAVQTDYGAVAVAGSSCCTSESAATPASCCSAPAEGDAEVESRLRGEGTIQYGVGGYSAEELADLPAEAASISLGCGNPAAMAALRPGQVVLDIGSGGGIDAFYAARRVGPTGRVIGLDMTPAMIERARRSAAGAGLGQVEFRLGQAEAMPVEDGTVDVVLSNCVINLCEDKGKVFEEAYRVLKEGGRLTISDMVTDGPLPMHVHAHPELWSGCLHGALPEREYLDLVAQAGFRDIRATRSGLGGQVEGVGVYSLSVVAHKGACSEPERDAPAFDVIPLTASGAPNTICCG